MLQMIMGEPSSFVNHYLNIVATGYSPLLGEAHKIMKGVILAKAITGEGFGKSGLADTFILNVRMVIFASLLFIENLSLCLEE